MHITKKDLAELLRFALVGVINTAVGWAVMFSCYNILHLSYWVSSVANYVVGGVCSFFLNKYFTFSAKQFSAWECVRFALCIVVCYGISYGAARPFMRYILMPYSPKVQDNAAMLFGSCVFTGLNFLGQKFFVFRKKNAA